MNATPLHLPEVLHVAPQVFGDDRGYFLETWHHTRYAAAGIPGPFVQDNLSYSRQGILRGLHFQNPHGQGKLVSVPWGEIFDVAVDIRTDSPRFGRWTGANLSGTSQEQLYIPPGFAHGFYVRSEQALVTYKCTDFYHPECEASIRWDDPAIGIDWPDPRPTLAPKDRDAPLLGELPARSLPHCDDKAP